MKPDPTAVKTPSPVPASAAVGGRAMTARIHRSIRVARVVLVVMLVGGGAASGWWWLRRPGIAAPTPPLPDNINKAELRKSIEEARRLVQEKPRSADAWSALGLLLLAHKCNAEADTCFAEASRLDPASPYWFYYRYVASLRLNNDPDQLLYFLRQADQRADLLPEEYRVALRLRLAETLLEREEIAEAEKVYRSEGQKYPKSERVALGLGYIAFRQGDNQKAVELLTPLQITVSARQVTQLLAMLSQKQNDRAATERFEQRLASLGPDTDWPDPFYALIYEYESPEMKAREMVPQLVRQGAYRQAAEICVARLKERPQLSLYLGAGVNFVRSGDFDRGLEMLWAAERLEPDNSTIAFAIAEGLLQWGNAERERDSASPTSMKHWREAVVSARRAVQLKKSHALAYLVLGRALILLGEPEAAVEELQRGVEYRPEFFQLQYYLGLAYLESAGWFRPEHYQQATLHLENARKLDTTNPLPVKALERLHFKKG
jgi:tetratricopeptide (TPR) repeat protein